MNINFNPPKTQAGFGCNNCEKILAEQIPLIIKKNPTGYFATAPSEHHKRLIISDAVNFIKEEKNFSSHNDASYLLGQRITNYLNGKSKYFFK